MDRLQLLVFSFYREEDWIKAQLEPLKYCQFTRSWGSIRIECLDEEHLQEISQLLEYLKLPFEALGLGQQIVLRVKGRLQKTYPMHVSFHTDLLA